MDNITKYTSEEAYETGKYTINAYPNVSKIITENGTIVRYRKEPMLGDPIVITNQMSAEQLVSTLTSIGKKYIGSPASHSWEYRIFCNGNLQKYYVSYEDHLYNGDVDYYSIYIGDTLVLRLQRHTDANLDKTYASTWYQNYTTLTLRSILE